MDEILNKVLFSMGCIIMFQIMDYLFNLPIPSLSVDLPSHNLKPFVESNIKLLLTIIAFHKFLNYKGIFSLYHKSWVIG